jgi:hypothetical protein
MRNGERGLMQTDFERGEVAAEVHGTRLRSSGKRGVHDTRLFPLEELVCIPAEKRSHILVRPIVLFASRTRGVSNW